MKAWKIVCALLIVCIIFIGLFFYTQKQVDRGDTFLVEVSSIIMEEDTYWDILYDNLAYRTKMGEIFDLFNQDDVIAILKRAGKNDINGILIRLSPDRKERIYKLGEKYEIQNWQYTDE